AHTGEGFAGGCRTSRPPPRSCRHPWICASSSCITLQQTLCHPERARSRGARRASRGTLRFIPQLQRFVYGITGLQKPVALLRGGFRFFCSSPAAGLECCVHHVGYDSGADKNQAEQEGTHPEDLFSLAAHDRKSEQEHGGDADRDSPNLTSRYAERPRQLGLAEA